MVTEEDWIRTRAGLTFGQRFRGTVTRILDPGATGIFVDIGLPVGGFVDVLLPISAEHWPAEGAEADFEVWWADERHRVRLKPVDRRFLREDFDEWQAEWRPRWPEDVPVERAWVTAAVASRRATGLVEEPLRAAGWRPGRRVSVDGWREALERGVLVRMHAAAERFLAEFGGLEMEIGGPGVDVGRTPFHFRPDRCAGEEDRFAEWSETLGRDLFPIGELDEGRFFLGIDETGEIYLVETWLATYGPVQDALEKLVLGVAPTRVASAF
ncbi:SUKH-3 domain-containing protein [Streptacidiphilus griseoplanus]|uniref:SUKH-3 domain-containing protein n=1 Tax=Peterkaempfera griseoplana TaxID=66896 RepID=UPI0007C6DBCD|nr:SUKH-3 domain-containing protein [Peterkaempfera griseoplana]